MPPHTSSIELVGALSHDDSRWLPTKERLPRSSSLARRRPGEEGGTAIVNLLLGDANPSGHLAQAWQRSAGYIHTPTSPWFQIHSDMVSGDYFGNGDNSPLSPLFPFSFGLSCESARIRT